MIDFDWGSILDNFYESNCTETKNLIEDTSLLQIFTLAPKIVMLMAQGIRNKNLATVAYDFLTVGYLQSVCYLQI